MADYGLKYIRINIFICYLILMTQICMISTLDKKEEIKLLEIAKQRLIRKEREYLKNKPLSEELLQFINRCKRENKLKSEKNAEGELDKDHLYAMQNGDIVPLSDLKPDNAINDSNSKDFTIIPLIVPIKPKVERKHVTQTAIEDVATTASGASAAILTTTNSDTASNTTSSGDETAAAGDDSTEDVNASSKKEERVLSHVLQDVHELIQFEKEDMANPYEDSPCGVDGDWDSAMGGMQIQVNLTKGSHAPKIQLAQLPTKPPKNSVAFLANGTWSICGHAPFEHSAMIIMTAFCKENKKVATFIGECRICEGSESITGTWMIARSSRSCTDRKKVHMFLNDVMMKNNMRRIHNAHLESIYDSPNSTNTFCFESS